MENLDGLLTIGGRNAVLALIRHQRNQIERLFYSRRMASEVAEICAWLAAEHRIFREVPDADLERLTGGLHHGGLAASFRFNQPSEIQAAELASLASAGSPVILLDDVGNSHNLGAIVRTAAFLGIRHVLIAGGRAETVTLTGGAAWRVAEGGMSLVQLWRCNDALGLLNQAPAADGTLVTFITADHRGKDDIRTLEANLHRLGKPGAGGVLPILVLGNEERGVRAELRAACHFQVRIAGSGQLESLNVVHAAAIFLHALCGYWPPPVVAANQRYRPRPEQAGKPGHSGPPDEPGPGRGPRSLRQSGGDRGPQPVPGQRGRAPSGDRGRGRGGNRSEAPGRGRGPARENPGGKQRRDPERPGMTGGSSAGKPRTGRVIKVRTTPPPPTS